MSIHCMWQIHESHSLPKCLMSMIPSKTQEMKYTLLRFKTYKQRFTHIANMFDKSPFCYRACLDDNYICPATIGSCLFWPCVITGQHFLLSSAGTQYKNHQRRDAFVCTAIGSKQMQANQMHVIGLRVLQYERHATHSN